MGMKVLKVGSGTGAVELGSALVHAVYRDKRATMRAIGPLAVSQAVKAIAIAQHHATERGLHLSATVEFVDVMMPEGRRSALELTVTATADDLAPSTLV